MVLNNILWVQFIILLGGTIFAWYQWYKVYKQAKVCGPSCAHPDPNCQTCFNPEKPFSSKCFFGAIFFTIGLIFNIWALYILNLMMTVGV